MFRFDAEKKVQLCDGFNRRDFLHAGALSTLGFGLTDLFQLQAQGGSQYCRRQKLYYADACRRSQSA